MEVFVLVPYADTDLLFEVYNLDENRTVAFLESMDQMPRFGEYRVEIDVPISLPIGNYYFRIFTDLGVNRKIGYIRIVSPTEYHIVDDFGDFEREPSAIEIEDELNNNFSVD